MSYHPCNGYTLKEILEIARARKVSCDTVEDLPIRSARYKLLIQWMIDELSKLPLTDSDKYDRIEEPTIYIGTNNPQVIFTPTKPMIFVDGHWRESCDTKTSKDLT